MFSQGMSSGQMAIQVWSASENFRIENVVEAVKIKCQSIRSLGRHSQGKGKKKEESRKNVPVKAHRGRRGSRTEWPHIGDKGEASGQCQY